MKPVNPASHSIEQTLGTGEELLIPLKIFIFLVSSSQGTAETETSIGPMSAGQAGFESPHWRRRMGTTSNRI